MPSNVRKHDLSCKNFTSTKYYQCITCDLGNKLFICVQCLKNGDHQNHQVKLKYSYETMMTFLKLCNCGDATGLIYCNQHSRCNMEENDKPLYNNYLQMNVFIRLFNLSLNYFQPIAKLNQIRRVTPGTLDWDIIKTYFENSKLSSKVDIKIRTVWSVYRKDKEHLFIQKGFEKFWRMLLWHGTHTENMSGILEKGFVLPKSTSAVANGSMFGKGVYFSDRVSKSAQYCTIEGEGIVFLCEVSLGSMWREGKATNYQNVPLTFQSVKGVGKFKPDPNGDLTFNNKIIVPAGKTIPNKDPDAIGSHLNYNEYIVFDPQRILIKFIVQIELKK